MAGDPDLTPPVMLALIGLGAVIVEADPATREAILARIDADVGDPRRVPIHDGDHLRMSTALRAMWERLLPTWLA